MVKIPRAEETLRQPRLPAGGTARPFVSAPRDAIGPAAERAAVTTGRAAREATGAVAGAAMSVADTVLNLRERDKVEQMKSARFKAQTALIDFETKQTQFARDTLEASPAGAFGYTTQVTENFAKEAKRFFAGIPDPLKPEFDAKLTQLEQSIILDADKVERIARTDYYTKTVETGLESLTTQFMDGGIEHPDLVAQGKELIRVADVPLDTKQSWFAAWRKQTATNLATREIARGNADKVLLDLGFGSDAQKAKSSVNRLFDTMVVAESSGDPNAVSNRGAVGLMQVRPSTARDIAKELPDPSFPAEGTDAEITEYLKQPQVNKQYGQYYMRKQLANFNNDLEAALIAYNAGPANAAKWLKAGRDYAVLPKPGETQPYVQKIMAYMGAEPTQTYAFGKEGNFVTAATFRSRNYTWANLRNNRFRNAIMDASAIAALDDVTDAFGQGPLTITSAYRSTEHNSKVSFTKASRHTKGDAFDIDVSRYSDEEKARLISLFISTGARGIGHYDNGTIHIDFRPGKGNGPGGLALWYGQNRDYRKGEQWFAAGVEQGLTIEGRSVATVPGGPVNPIYSALSWGERAAIAAGAEKQLNAKKETDQASAVSNYKLAMLYEPQKIKEMDILNDGRIFDNGVKASVITALRKAQEQGMELAAFQSLISNGGKANPLDKKQRGFADQIWQQTQITPEHPEYTAQVVEFSRRLGIAPKQVTHATRRALTSDWQNPEMVDQAAAHLDVASKILANTPDAFLGQDGAAAITKAVAAYDYGVSLGDSSAQAATRVLRSADDQWVAQTKDLQNQAKDNADKISVGTIANLFDEFTGPGGEPIVGYGDPRRQSLLVSEFRQMYTEEFIDSGDADVAMARTQDRFKKLYGVSRFAGEDYLMKYPPEKVGFPRIAGSYDYIHEQAVAAVKAETGVDVDPARIVLSAAPGVTDVDVETGRYPRYTLLTQNDEGLWEQPVGLGYFTPDVASAIAADNEKIRVTPEQEALLQASLDRRFAPVTRTDVVMRLLDEGYTRGLGGEMRVGLTLDTGETLLRALPEDASEPVIIDPETRIIYNYDGRTNTFTPTDKEYDRGL